MPFYFVLKVPAQYLPWVLCIFSMIVAGSGMSELVGIFVGHIYYFFKFRYAQDFGGPDLMETPQVITIYVLWTISYDMIDISKLNVL